MKRRIRFQWILPACYLAAIVVLVIGNATGAGHTPRSLQFLVILVGTACYPLGLLLPKGMIHNVLLGAGLCCVLGLLTYAIAGALIDFVIDKLRQRRITKV